MITSNRREFIKRATALTGYSLLSTTGLLRPQQASADWIATNFEPSSMAQVLKNVLKGKPVVDSDKIHVKLPSSADNKTPVPIVIQSDLKNVKSISILVEQNLVPLVATFELSSTLEPFVSTRLKLMRSSFIFVLLETEKVFYSMKQTITVSEGVC